MSQIQSQDMVASNKQLYRAIMEDAKYAPLHPVQETFLGEKARSLVH